MTPLCWVLDGLNDVVLLKFVELSAYVVSPVVGDVARTRLSVWHRVVSEFDGHRFTRHHP